MKYLETSIRLCALSGLRFSSALNQSFLSRDSLSRPYTLLHFFTQTATPSRIGRMVVNKSFDS